MMKRVMTHSLVHPVDFSGNMQSKETGDIVGLIHRIRKKYYHYKVCGILIHATHHPHLILFLFIALFFLSIPSRDNP